MKKIITAVFISMIMAGIPLMSIIIAKIVTDVNIDASGMIIANALFIVIGIACGYGYLKGVI
jgi:hypothetical protein